MNSVSERIAKLTPEQREAALRRLKPNLFKPAVAGSPAARTSSKPFRPDVDANYALQVRTYGVLDSLSFRVISRPELADYDVEVEVYAASLNFRDLMICLGMYPLFEDDARPALGFDCAGVVSRVGSRVSDFKVGDPVMGFPYITSGCFSRYTSAHQDAFLRKPDYLSFDEAAATIGVMITAYFSLVEVGRLSSDERVLIHAAAGGVGLAAVQIAQRIGAEIFATAGNEEKRAYLRSRGVEHVMDSRSLAFVEETLALTSGEGVDLILNSLPGEAIDKGFTLLKAYGRFIELGRKDVIENRPLGMALFDQALLFTTVNISFRGEMRRRINAGVMQLLDDGHFTPLPMRTYAMSKAKDAFAFMSSGKHIGKIVLQLHNVPVDVVD